MIRIANGQGFWGDWLEAPVRLVEEGPLDYLTLDYLAEVTMSILQKQRKADPALGYARDFPVLMGRISGTIRERHIRVVANAGGVNPVACAEAVLREAPGLKVAIVTGDDVLDRLDEFLGKGYPMRDLDSGEPLLKIRSRITSANAYLGAFPIAQAIGTGADVVITGRCTDPALALAPLIHEFGWRENDWDRLAAGTVAGHIVECGPQTTGGNSQVRWTEIQDLAHPGYPIIEAESDGTFVVTKHAGTGGRVDEHVVKEQLVYELGDPQRYLSPDCTVDFTSFRVADAGSNRVAVSGVRGGPGPEAIKLSVSYTAGWKAIGTLVYTWPDALEKVRAADAIVRRRLRDLGVDFDEVYTEFLGYNACHQGTAAVSENPAEIQLRIGVRGQDRSAVDRFTRELIPLVLSGPPGATGYGEGRPAVREVIAYWGALVPREEVRPNVQLFQS
jgi:hypothetical protein